MEDEEAIQSSSEVEAFDYQTEILNEAKKRNVIVKLDTGCGKTYISIMIMRYFLHMTDKSVADGGKRIVFLVQNVHLVYQQAAAIQKYLAITDTEVGRFHGEVKRDDTVLVWSADTWHRVFNKYRVLVFTADLFLTIILHKKFQLQHICLMVLDECHHATKGNAFRRICEEVQQYYKSPDSLHNDPISPDSNAMTRLPRLLGLSATVLKGDVKLNSVEEKLIMLERLMRSHVITSLLPRAQQQGVREQVITFKLTRSPADVLAEGELELQRRLNIIKQQSSTTNGSGTNEDISPDSSSAVELAREALSDTYSVLQNMGLVGCAWAARDCLNEVRRMSALTTLKTTERNILDMTKNTLQDVLLCSNAVSPKVQTLLHVLASCCHNPLTENMQEVVNESTFDMQLFDDIIPNDLEMTDAQTSGSESTSLKRPHPFSTSLPTVPTVTEHNLHLITDDTTEEMTTSSSTTCDPSSFRAIVFVTKRRDTFALMNVMQAVSKAHPTKLGFLKPAAITGCDNGDKPFNSMGTTFKQQDKILSRFRRGEVNVLIATSVVEEGLDVQLCNLVVHMDPPQEFRSYIQAKGRARRSPSFYVVLCPEEKRAQTEYNLERFRKLNQRINEVITKRSAETALVDPTMSNGSASAMTRECFAPEGPDGPRIFDYTAVSVLHKYLGSLRSDTITPIRPHITYVHKDGGVCAMLTLPRPCPIFDFIEGPLSGNMRSAKHLVALEACKKLYKAGELSKDLLPKKHSVIVDICDADDLLDSVDGTHKTGTTGSKRNYPIAIAESLSSNLEAAIRSNSETSRDLLDYMMKEEGSQLYVHTFEFHPPLWECLSSEVELAPLLKCLSGLALLTPSPIRKVEEVARFPLFLPHQMTVECRVRQVCQLDRLSVDQVERLRKAHEALFHVLHAQQKANWFSTDEDSDNEVATFLWDWKKTKFPFFVTPVITNSGQIDWPAVEELHRSYQANFQETLMSRDKKLWPGALVTFLGVPKDKRPCVILKVRDDLSCHSNMSTVNKHEDGTFRDMFLRRYPDCKEHIETAGADLGQQPILFSTRFISFGCTVRYRPMGPDAESNPQSKRLRTKPNQMGSHNAPYLIPELCLWVPLKPHLFAHLRLLPDILYRLNQLLLVEELYQQLEAPLEWETMSDKTLCLDFDSKDPVGTVSITRLLSALTCPQAQDRQNLERFEILGDSFLKYISSVYLHNLTPGHHPEGEMTERRSAVISNKNLYLWARSRGLHRFMFAHTWDLTQHFIPPGCVLNVTIPPHKLENYQERLLTDKSVADCVEALIGCVLFCQTQSSALRLMRWFAAPRDTPGMGDPLRLVEWGLVSPDNLEEVYADMPPLKCPYLNTSLSSEETHRFCDALLLGRDFLEGKLGYTFKNKTLLLEATTHPSDLENKVTNCYQRLEFLGDAAVDYITTANIFNTCTEKTPGEITDLRSAMVSNNLFAAILVKFGLHKCIRYGDSKLFELINIFADNQESQGHPMRDTELSLYEGHNGEKVMLKVLGDVVESLMGAVFLDCGMDLAILNGVLNTLTQDVFKDFVQNVPINLVRLCHEKFPGMKFSPAEVVPGQSLVRVQLTWKQYKWEITERNGRLAKHALARRLLKEHANIQM